jgi:hypothetical protein
MEAKKQVTPKQERAIIALLNNPKIEEAARVSGVNAGTLFRWLNEPTFAATYRAARRETFSHAVARLQRASTIAVTVLVNICLDPKTGSTARVSACRAILEHGSKGTSVDELEGRIEELERKQKVRAV